MTTQARKDREKENRREQILAAAVTIMSENGVRGLNIDRVAERTELAKGTIYLYFKSKEEILATLSVRARQSILKEFQKINDSSKDPIEKLVDIASANHNFYKKNPLLHDLMLLFESDNTLTETDEMYQSSQAITNLVASIVKEAQDNGDLNSALDPLALTFCLWGMSMGMIQLIKVRGELIKNRLALSEKKLVANMLEIFANGMRG